MSGTGRLSLYILGNEYLWQCVFADDLEWVVRGPDLFENLLMAMFPQVIAGVPDSWKKFGEGAMLDCIGYYLDCASFEAGIAVSMSRWLVTWIRDVLASGGVVVAALEEVPGRIGFAAMVPAHPC